MRQLSQIITIWLLSISLASAQSGPGQVSPNQVIAGPPSGVTAAPPLPRALVAGDMPSGTSYFDATYCSTFGYIIVRLTGAWTCSNSIPVPINWYGADPTGVSTSSSAFNSAATACLARNQCTIRLPATSTGGTYLLSTQVTLIGNGINVQCDPGVIVVNGTTNAAAIYLGDGVTGYFSNRVTGCNFQQSGSVVAAAGNYGLVANKQFQVVFDHLIFSQNLQNGMLLTGSSQAIISNTQGSNAKAGGLDIENGNDIVISNSRFDANGTFGIQINDTSGFYASNVTSFNNGSNGWHLGTASTCNLSGPNPTCNNDGFFSNVVGDTSFSDNWFLEYCQNCVFVNLWGATQKMGGSGNGVKLQSAKSGALIGLSFTNCEFYNNTQSGIVASDGGFGTPNVSLVNCQIGTKSGNGAFGVQSNGSGGISLIGGEIRNNSSGALSVASAVPFYAFGVSGYTQTPTTQVGATYTVANTDLDVIANAGGTMTLTLPSASSFSGRILRLRTIANQAVISNASNVVPLVGGAAGTAILAATAGKWAILESDGTSWQIMSGN